MKLFFLALFFTGTLFSQSDSVVIYLVGDAGNDTAPGSALLALQKRLKKDSAATVIYLGDNVYPHGLNDRIDDGKVSDEEKKLMSQFVPLKGHKGSAYMIPGNHDWKAQRQGGHKFVKAQAEWVNAYFKDSLKIKGGYYPTGAMPGPVSVLIAEKIRLIMIDSQWFIQKRSGKIVGKDKDGRKATENACWTSLEAEILASILRGEQLIFAVHHPLISAGTHGAPMKFVRFMVNYTPLQLFGLMGVNRALSQNVNQPGYKKYRKKLEGLLKASGKDHILVAGHEHNFQVWKMEWGTQIISGSGSKSSSFKKHFLEDPRLLDKNDKQEGVTRMVIRNIDGTRIISWEFVTN